LELADSQLLALQHQQEPGSDRVGKHRKMCKYISFRPIIMGGT